MCHLFRSNAGAPRRAVWPLAVALGCLLLTGCYRLQPVEPGALAPQQRVRAHLRPAGAERVAEALGAPREVVDGRLVSVGPERIALLVPSAYTSAAALYQEIHLPLSEVVALQRRQLDGLRTGLLVGAGVAVAAAVVVDMFSGDHGGTTTGPVGPGTPEARVPLFRLRVP